MAHGDGLTESVTSEFPISNIFEPFCIWTCGFAVGGPFQVGCQALWGRESGATDSSYKDGEAE